MSWSSPTPSEIFAVHGAVLPTGPKGEVLIFGGDEHYSAQTEAQNGNFKRTRIFDVDQEKLTTDSNFPSPDSDVFCSHHSFIADGRLLIAGGTTSWPSGQHHNHNLGFHGHNKCWTFLPRDRKWLRVANLEMEPGTDKGGGRWYPGTAPLPSGEMIAFAGHPLGSDTRHRNMTPERYSPFSNSWEYLPAELANSAKEPGSWYNHDGSIKPSKNVPEAERTNANFAFSIPTLMYPRTFALPNRKFFFATRQPLEALSNSFKDYGKEDGPRSTSFFDLANGQFTGTPISLNDGSYDGWNYPAVLLPIMPGDNPEIHVMLLGAQTDYRINLSDSSPTWRTLPTRPTNKRRIHADAVILPTGEICLVNGVSVTGRGDDPKTPNNDETTDQEGVQNAETYNPGVTWDPANNGKGTYEPFDGSNSNSPFGDSWLQDSSAANVVRNYHSIGLLLPTGKVFVAGGNTNQASGNPRGGEVKKEDGTKVPVAEMTCELFSPSYLDTPSQQPDLNGAPTFVTYRQSFSIQTPQASSIQRVAMIRCGSVTHNFNPDQRYVGLEITARSGIALTVTAPYDSWTAPPGYYMLWIVDTNNKPCKLAKFVRLGDVSCDVYMSRDSVSKEEVESYGNGLTLEKGFNIYFNGFRDTELTGNPSVTLFDETANAVLTGNNFQVLFNERTREIEPGTDGYKDLTQRVTYAYNIRINNVSLFDVERRIIRITIRHHGLEKVVRFALSKQPTPYMIDVEPGEDNPHWLSTDVRVFKVLEGQKPFGDITQGGGSNSPFSYIDAVVKHFRGQDNDGNHDFLKIKEPIKESKLSLKQTERVGGQDKKVYNYAIAKVRYRANTTPAPDVRVFFRMAPALSTSLAYNTSQNYRVHTDGNRIVPLLGIQGGAVKSIPFFATQRADTGTLELSAQPADTLNVETINPTAGEEVTMYFGCWLDINQPEQKWFVSNPGSTPDGPWSNRESILQMVRNEHQCLVAEVYFTPDPTQNGHTPGQSDNLAQRNIAFESSDNPGSPATHTVATTLEISRSPVKTLVEPLQVAFSHEMIDKDGNIRDHDRFRPDELVFQWNNLPRDSEVTLFFGNLKVDEILQAARGRQSSAIMEKVDEHTIRLRVAETSYLPVPNIGKQQYPSLLSVALPNNVTYGQEFVVDVHQFSGTSRLIIGSFQFKIPVGKAENLVEKEKEKLSIMRYIAEGIPQGDRWYPIFSRYLVHIADRVQGFGGNPDAIKPHPNGEGVPYIPSKPSSDSEEKWCPEGLATSLILALVLSLSIFVSSPGTLAALLAVGVVLVAGITNLWSRRCCRKMRCAWLDHIALGAAVPAVIGAIVHLGSNSAPYSGFVLLISTLLLGGAITSSFLSGCRRGCCDDADCECSPQSGESSPIGKMMTNLRRTDSKDEPERLE